jgi:hypothetical protein
MVWLVLQFDASFDLFIDIEGGLALQMNVEVELRCDSKQVVPVVALWLLISRTEGFELAYLVVLVLPHVYVDVALDESID